MRSLLFAVLVLTLPAAHAQMYKCTEGGKTRYSDKPFTDCKSALVKGQPNVALSSPTGRRAAQREPHPDPQCERMRREMNEVRRAGIKDVAGEQRMQELRDGLKPCS